MKKQKTFNYCEYCDLPLEQEPTLEQYENGMIYLGPESKVLLPEKAAKKGIYSVDLHGYYCNTWCLLNHLRKVLNLPADK